MELFVKAVTAFNSYLLLWKNSIIDVWQNPKGNAMYPYGKKNVDLIFFSHLFVVTFTFFVMSLLTKGFFVMSLLTKGFFCHVFVH